MKITNPDNTYGTIEAGTAKCHSDLFHTADGHSQRIQRLFGGRSPQKEPVIGISCKKFIIAAFREDRIGLVAVDIKGSVHRRIRVQKQRDPEMIELQQDQTFPDGVIGGGQFRLVEDIRKCFFAGKVLSDNGRDLRLFRKPGMDGNHLLQHEIYGVDALTGDIAESSLVGGEQIFLCHEAALPDLVRRKAPAGFGGTDDSSVRFLSPDERNIEFDIFHGSPVPLAEIVLVIPEKAKQLFIRGTAVELINNIPGKDDGIARVAGSWHGFDAGDQVQGMAIGQLSGEAVVIDSLRDGMAVQYSVEINMAEKPCDVMKSGGQGKTDLEQESSAVGSESRAALVREPGGKSGLCHRHLDRGESCQEKAGFGFGVPGVAIIAVLADQICEAGGKGTKIIRII